MDPGCKWRGWTSILARLVADSSFHPPRGLSSIIETGNSNECAATQPQPRRRRYEARLSKWWFESTDETISPSERVGWWVDGKHRFQVSDLWWLVFQVYRLLSQPLRRIILLYCEMFPEWWGEKTDDCKESSSCRYGYVDASTKFLRVCVCVYWWTPGVGLVSLQPCLSRQQPPWVDINRPMSGLMEI